MSTLDATIPQTQCAVQLVGADELRLNPDKPVPRPGPHEILVRVEAVGLCFSDLKLLKQFDQHARKSEIVSGLDPDVLDEIQSYVPGGKATVPGHEVVGHIVAVGDQVRHHQIGERCLFQTDYRDLPTAGSNAAFGYNFEGGLQEYALVDERVVVDRQGERFLIPVGEQRSASAVALVEPWACVEDSYVNRERQTILAGGRLLVVADDPDAVDGLEEAFSPDGPPQSISRLRPAQAGEAADESFDDIVYLGADGETLETLNDKLAPKGIINIVLGGQSVGRPVNLGVGRVHYGMTRWIGTTGSRISDSYGMIPSIVEIRAGDRILVVGAGGPMGQMHVIRNICSGVAGIQVVGTDFDDARLESLQTKAGPLADANSVELKLVNTKTAKPEGSFSYIALMAPIAALVEQAIQDATDDAIVNIFAGIPAPTRHEIDLDTLIRKRCFMFGTSGSVIEDMKIVLRKVEAGQLDTNCSVDAISGMAGATDGIAAVADRTLAGKIIVYPSLHDVGLIPLSDLDRHFPSVAEKLDHGQWTLAAERELLRAAADPA
ncbi:MAG: alcohol dehydrogenase catalytic domain-containing protein [Phycisphaerae bacterium]|nr:alcohol dehydrogenase catalytic domain-containing protein [Phycisphaerae bacterium]